MMMCSTGDHVWLATETIVSSRCVAPLNTTVTTDTSGWLDDPSARSPRVLRPPSSGLLPACIRCPAKPVVTHGQLAPLLATKQPGIVTRPVPMVVHPREIEAPPGVTHYFPRRGLEARRTTENRVGKYALRETQLAWMQLTEVSIAVAEPLIGQAPVQILLSHA